MSNKILQTSIIIFLLGLLIGVRMVEHLFYDPLNIYFENDYLHVSLPEINYIKLIMSMILRFLINSGISILIIWLIFKNTAYVQFSLKFYSIILLILLPTFFLLILNSDFYLPTFYVRRFLIQPLFVFLLIPAFHFQNHLNKNKGY